MARIFASVSALALFGGLACSSREAQRQSEHQASVAVESSHPSRGDRALAALHARPTFDALVKRAEKPLLDGATLHLPRVERPMFASEKLHAVVPTSAEAPTRLHFGSSPGAWITLAPRDFAPAGATFADGPIVFANARPSTDAVHVLARGRYEEARVLHDATAPGDFRWTIELGPRAVDVRVRERLVEVLDAEGRVVLVSHPAFAEDATGIRRDMDAQVYGSGSTRTLELSLDRSGMTYPIVVDPTWSIVAPTSQGHANAGSALLPDGRVLLAGGIKAAGTTAGYSIAEVYDPKTNTWKSAGTLPGVTAAAPWVNLTGFFTLRAFSTGKAVFAGGSQPARTTTLSLAWDGATTWTPTASPLNVARAQAATLQLADGRVLYAGGTTVNTATSTYTWYSSAEIFDPATQKWTLTANDMSAARTNFSLVQLPSGQVLAAGGDTYDASYNVTGTLSTVDVFDPTTLKWSPGTPLPLPRDGYAAVPMPSGDVQLLLGGQYTSGAVFSSYFDRIIYSASTSKWNAPTPVVGLSISTFGLKLADGRFLFPNSADATLWDPTSDTYTWAGAATNNYLGRAYVALNDGRAMIACGRDFSVSPFAPSAEVDIWSQAVLGGACTEDFDCKSGHCTDGACCAVATCGAGATCGGSGSTGSCRKLLGQTCAATTDCASGFCVDGVCCNSACAGQCQACDDPYSLGTCKAISGAPHGGRTACFDGGSDPCKAQTCNGSDATACHVKTGTVACGANACSSGIETHVGTCGATGACVAPANKPCGAYQCGATTCNTSCASSGDCAPGYWCSSNVCVATLGLGKPCTDPSSCSTGTFCVDGVCCGSASCSKGASCGLSGHEGSCFKSLGTTCTVDAECGSGHCVDSVCCGTTCDLQCEACDAKGSEGTCVAISGAPHGARTACASDPSNPCKSAACDGATTGSCAGLAGSEVTCQPSKCDGSSFTPRAVCDGKGSCATSASATCSGYVCADAQTCRTSCKDDGDCASTFHCASGSCVAITDTCSADGNSSVHAAGATTACSPYVCRAGECLASCGTSADCQTGNECSFATRTCVPTATASSAKSGGCSTSGGRGAGGVGWWIAGAVAMLRWRRKSGAAALALLATTGCGRSPSGNPSEPAPSQSSTLASAATNSIEPMAVDAHASLAAARAASPRLSRFATSGIHLTDHGLVPDAAPAGLSVLLALDGAMHLEDSTDRTLHVDVVSVDDAPKSAGQLVEGAVHRSVGERMHAYVAATSTGAEEIRVLRDASAPSTFRLRVTASDGLTLRLRQGRIEAVDRGGRSRIASAPMWAVDAKGHTKDLDTRVVDHNERSLLVEASLDTAALSFPVVIDPAWSAIPAMAHARSMHVATPLPDGRVLVAGGTADLLADILTASTSAEIYDPKSNTWTSTPNLAFGHVNAATALVGGKVIVVGGTNGIANGSTSNAEVYDPVANKWTTVAAMPEAREGLFAELLPSGKALFFGGALFDSAGNNTLTTRSFLYDASAGWAETGKASVDRQQAAHGVMADGTVIVAGGTSNDYSLSAGGVLSAAEQYNPSTGTWAAIAPLSVVRVAPSGAPFAAGKQLIVAGGQASLMTYAAGYSTTEIYDLTAKVWKSGPSMGAALENRRIVPLPSGRLLFATGDFHSFATTLWEVFDPVSLSFTTRGRTIDSASNSTLCPLPGGHALFTGGTGAAGGSGSNLTSARAEVFAPQPAGGSCTGPDACTSGYCVDGVCCSSASCAVGSVCNGAASPGNCAQNDGLTCSKSSDCASGNCVDGICCESACADTCAACDVPGSLGRCRPVAGAPHGTRTACTTTPSECGLACDGADTKSCHNRASGTVCGAAACKASMLSHVSTCDGSGSCSDTPSSCGGYSCDATGTKCLTTCSKSADCATGYTCGAGACVPLPGKGADCSTTGACGSGLTCVTGVCCSSSSCPGDSTCPLGLGDCVKVDGATCSADADCQHGHCVDGTCCNEACAGPCGACDVVGKEGKCVAVTGKPHGTRSCGAPGSDACAVGVCDGADKTTCAKKPGAETSCRTASCAAGKATLSAFCDGSGACPAAIVSDCGAYACNADGTACRTRCTAATDCATGAFCSGGACVPFSGTCSGDGLSIAVKGAGTLSCAPYVCNGGSCLTKCAASTDCAPGATCDATSSTCSASPQASSSGGCSTGRASGQGAWSLVALSMVGALCWRSRRRSGPRAVGSANFR